MDYDVAKSSPGPVVYAYPPISSAAPGDPINIDVKIIGVVATESLYSWEFNMSFNPSILNVLKETNTTNNELANTTVRVKQPPWANFTISPKPPYVKRQDLTFNASASTPDGGELIDPSSYFWNFGDLSTTYGKVVLHTYTSAANYTVTLTVTDTEGLSSTVSKTITVYDHLSAVSSTTEVLVGETVAGETYTAGNVLIDSVFTASGSPIRDVAVTKVVSYPNTVVGGGTVYINITVQNNPLGYQPESFTVMAYANTTKVGETIGTLDPGKSQTYTFTWKTTPTTKAGNYIIKGTIPSLPGVREGPFLKSVGTTRLVGYKVDNVKGTVVASWALFPYPAQGAVGNGTLATIFFEVIAEGKTNLHFYKTQLWTYSGGWIVPIAHTTADGIFTILGDVNGDGTVNTSDLFDLGRAYGSHGPNYNYPGEPASPYWNSNCDFNKNNKVDASDLSDLSKNYGKSYP